MLGGLGSSLRTSCVLLLLLYVSSVIQAYDCPGDGSCDCSDKAEGWKACGVNRDSIFTCYDGVYYVTRHCPDIWTIPYCNTHALGDPVCETTPSGERTCLMIR